ncbi:MAG: lytic transglycosylase domain-containing protein [Actinomycetes bacterium]
MGLNPVRAGFVACAAIGVVLHLSVSGAAAAPSDPPPGSGLTAAVSAIPSHSVELDAVRAVVTEREQRRDRTYTDLTQTRERLVRATNESFAMRALAARRREQAKRLVPVAERLRRDLRSLSIEGFITGFGTTDALDPTLSAAEQGRRRNLRVLASEALGDTVADTRLVEASMRRYVSDASTFASCVERTSGLADGLRRNVERLTASLRDADADLLRAHGNVAKAEAGATIDGTDLPALALDAYWRASRALRVTNPSCGVPWWALAGIGRTESAHGHFRGSGVFPDGRVDPPIYGPMLDGSGGFARIGDSDRGLLDGTAAGDRAVGPMQFLPGTWRTVGRDATGDGVADPHNLYDAALGAGALLCRRGAALDNEVALRRAFRTYNNSSSYVQTVWERSARYAESVPLR